MENVNSVIDRMRLVTNSATYADLANKMGVALATVNNWKRRNEVPEKNILKCIHLTNTTKEYLLYGKKDVDKTYQHIQGNNNIAFTGDGNNISKTTNSRDYNEDIKEIYYLLEEYASPKFLKDLKEKLLQIKALHG